MSAEVLVTLSAMAFGWLVGLIVGWEMAYNVYARRGPLDSKTKSPPYEAGS